MRTKVDAAHTVIKISIVSLIAIFIYVNIYKAAIRNMSSGKCTLFPEQCGNSAHCSCRLICTLFPGQQLKNA